MRTFAAVPGLLLVLFAVAEIFLDLFHPSGTGNLSLLIARVLFRVFRVRKSAMPLAGPLALVTVIGCWTFMVALGFATIYWSQSPGAIRPNTEITFPSCFYFSMEVITTLGLGEIHPQGETVRLLATLESLLGLALVTASVSWIVLLYPALARMHCLARRTFIARDAAKITGARWVDTGAQSLLAELLIGVIRARVDLIHFPMIWYFASVDDRGSVAGALPYLTTFADAAKKSDAEDILLGGTALSIALDELAGLLQTRFLGVEGLSTVEIFNHSRAFHRIDI